MIITCTRRLQFCAGHRVMGHENKCANFHGHNYVIFLTAQAESLGDSVEGQMDRLGRVIDFSVLKELIGAWIDSYWDHGFIVAAFDREALSALSHMEKQKIYQLPFNPTAENMALYILNEIGPQVLNGLPVKLTKVRLWETENCYADATL